MGIDYGSSFFDLICKFILQNSEKEMREDQKKIFVAAAKRAGKNCENVKNINWKEVFYTFIKLEEYATILNHHSKMAFNNRKYEEKNIFEEDLGELKEKLIREVERCNGAFTWKLQYDGCVLENVIPKGQASEFYREKELGKKQDKFAEIIKKVDNKQEHIIDIFYSKPKKRVEWRFSAIDGEKFYDELDNTSVGVEMSRFDLARHYKNIFSPEAWYRNCDLLWRVMKNWKKKEPEYCELKNLEYALCKLIPVAYKEDKDWRLKTREQWENEKTRIKGAIQKKVYALGLNKYAQDILEEEIEIFQEISASEEYKEYEKEVFCEKYVDLLMGANAYFQRKIGQIHNVSTNQGIIAKEDLRELYDNMKI